MVKSLASTLQSIIVNEVTGNVKGDFSFYSLVFLFFLKEIDKAINPIINFWLVH